MVEKGAPRADVILCDKAPGRTPAAGNDLQSHLIAGYFGKFLATQQFILSGGKSGVCLKLHPFCKKKRRLYFTDACATSFRPGVRLLERLCGKHPDALRVVKGDFAAYKKQDVQVVAAAPADQPAKADHKWSTLLHSFLQSLLTMDAQESAIGLK